MTDREPMSWLFPTSFNQLPNFVYFDEPNSLLCILFIILTPLLFNLVCMYEYNTKNLSNLFGSAKVACVFFSILQILCSNTRNYFFNQAVIAQPKFETPFNDKLEIIGYGLMAVGGLFVVTSFLRLGWFGTWHGDHFGILLPEKVTGFPFSVLDHPMYDGAVLIFIGSALLLFSLSLLLMPMSFLSHIVSSKTAAHFSLLAFFVIFCSSRSITGLALAFFVQIVYRITELFEGPFTDMIYKQAAAAKSR